MRGGTHAGLVGEQAARYAVAHRLLHGDADRAAEDSLRVKRRNKDRPERRDDRRMVDDQNSAAADNVEACHDRYQLFGDRRDTADTAEEDKRRDNRADDTDHDRRDAERGLKRRADRVGLHHVAGKAERKDDGQREEAREELAEFTGKARADVVDRAAGHMAVLIRGLVLLREHCLAVDGGHAKECTQPHPENRARAAGVQRRCRARDIARADLCCDRSGQCLERAHTVLARFFTIEREVAEQPLPARTELADLHKARADGKEDTRSNEQVQQNTVPHDVADLAYQISQLIH